MAIDAFNAHLDTDGRTIVAGVWRPVHPPLDPKLSSLQPYPVPMQHDFRGQNGVEHDWMRAPDLEELAQRILGEHEANLSGAAEYFDSIDFRWKREGGSKAGHLRVGATRKVGGAERHYTDAVFAIWLAADHLLYRGRALDGESSAPAACRYVEMVLAHELSHIGETEGDNPRPTLNGHDIEEFIWIAKAYPDVLEAPAIEFARQLKLNLRD